MCTETRTFPMTWTLTIIVTVGGSEAIDLAMRAMLNPGRGSDPTAELCLP